MLHGRKRRATRATKVTLAGLALVTMGLVPLSPAQAEPEIDDVEARVDRLYHEAEQASERVNDARIELTELRADLATLRKDQRRQQERMSDVREQVQDSLVRQYRGQSLSATGRVLVSDDPDAFVAGLTTMSAYDDLQDQLFASYQTEVKALGIRAEATESRVDQIARTEDRLAEEKETIDERLDEAKSLLSRLEEKEREEIVSRDQVRAAPAAVPASGRAGAAVQYALAQVGKAYVYGAAGPSAYDCSGLTMMAWAQAGVSLPHSSGAQYSSGAKVPSGSLRPGDLVFYYSPISHVGVYIGNGQIAHAANPGTGVAIAPLHSMPYVGAVRPG